ncbi:cyclic GMP-AMP synthase-like receptor 1 [Haliotis cracherodii]|uniref:cyclic GMP-AMP synthase-like receptor 1 n=1 Tax=Haliotis cracherodii TaxID=6455 RepID=UPI0039E86C7D
MRTRKMERFVTKMVDKGIICHPKRPKTQLRKFFEEEVSLNQDEIAEIADHFNELRSDVVSYLNKSTPWTWETFSAGSYYDGTKVYRPNEMDCQLIPTLDDSVTPDYEGCQPGHCRLKVNDHEEHGLHRYCDEGFINMDKFRKDIFRMLDKFQSGQRIKKDLTYDKSPSYRVIYKTTVDLPDIEIDFVAAIHVDEWPDYPLANNLRKKLSRDLPSEVDPKGIMDEGFNTVMKHCKADVPDKVLQWKMSFTYAEKMLSKHADKKCWKPVLRIIKRAKEIAKGDSDLSATSSISKQIEKAAEYTKRHFFPDSDGSLGLGTYPIRMLMWTLLYDRDLGRGYRAWQNSDTLEELHVSLGQFREMLVGNLPIPNLFMPLMGDTMTTARYDDKRFMYIMTLVIGVLFSEQPDD